MNYFKCGAIVLLAVLAATRCATAAAPQDGTGSGPENIFSSPMWDDGRAEFSVYSGLTNRYGQDRATNAHLVVVKEDLLRESLVKSDAGPIDGRTVVAIKLNFIADFRTGTYVYHQMATTMFERASFDVLKETMSHTEGCGITFVRIGPKHGALTHEAHSYWDGEADREVKVSWPRGEHTYADALPVWLRQWVHEGAPATMSLWLMPTQISGKSPIESTRPVKATIRRGDGGTLRVPAGSFATRRFDVTTPAGTDSYWFETRFPYVLIQLATAAGRKLELQRTLRLDYWKHHMNGDEKLIGEGD